MADTDTGVSHAPSRVCATWQIGEKYGNGMSLFVAGSDASEFLSNLGELFGSGTVDDYIEEWGGYVQNNLPGDAVTHDEAVKNLRSGGLIDDSPVHGEARKCKHGAMVARNGEKNGKQWSGWFCPTPKGSIDKCAPVFA